MNRPPTIGLLWFACVIGLASCSREKKVRGGQDERPNIPPVVSPPQASRPDSAKSSTAAGEMPVSLPVTEHTPIGVRIDTVTVWLDSSRIDQSVHAVSSTAALGHYDPHRQVVATCFRTADTAAGEEYVILQASAHDSAPVTDVLLTRNPDEIIPRQRCDSLSISADRISNSLGLRLGMMRSEVEHLLGPVGDTSRRVFTYAKYEFGDVPQDTSRASRERAVHAKVKTALDFRRDTVISIRIRRGPELPRFLE